MLLNTNVSKMNYSDMKGSDTLIKSKKLDEKGNASKYELLGTSYRHQTREFFDNSTLHGVRYIAERGRPFCERFMWFCFTAVGAVATCIIIVSLWEKFQTNPTITGLDTDFHNWDVLFPSITVCDRNPTNPELVSGFINKTWPDASNEEREKYVEFLQFLGTLSYASIKMNGAKFAGDSKLTTIGEDLRATVYALKQLVTNSDMSTFQYCRQTMFCFKVILQCEDFIFDCTFKADSEDCCEIFLPVFTEIGFCYAFNSRHIEKTWPWLQRKLDPYLEQYIHETDTKWSFVFDSSHKDTLVNVYIHSTDEMPGMDTNPQHVWDRRVEKISFSVKQTYTTADARQLSIKQRRCVFSDEIPLLTDTMYTYSACTRQCRMTLSRQYCGCVPHFYPKIDKFRYCTLTELRCIAENADKITNIDRCNCELGCTNTVYEVEKLTERDLTRSDDNDGESNPLESEFVSWPMVRYKREVLFGWVDLLVSFGGIAGLFLGFSLLSGVEILYYFTLRACCMYHRDKEELVRLRVEYSRRELPPYDLGLQPWWGRPPTASLHGPRAVLEGAESRPRTTRPQPILVREATRQMRPPGYSPPPVYQEYLP